jgi:adenosylcobinamide-GDP ribazoletransferase
VTGLFVAARYLTIVPVPGPAASAASGLHALGRAAGWFPVVGLALGVVLVLVQRSAAWLFPPLLAALLTVTVWKLVTGGLHLDGLADCLDGLMGRDPAHRLAIMHDSQIGAFGAVGLVLFLLLEMVAVAELPADPRGRALLVAPVVARAMPPLLARLFAAARPGGHGASFHASVGPRAPLAALCVALVVAAGALGVAGVVALAIAGLVAVGTARFLGARLGGITGDVHGAAVEEAELVVLLTVVAWTHARP